MRSLAPLFLASVLCAPAFAEIPKTQTVASGSQVTLALSDYETMRDANQRASATVVDTIRLNGTFRGRDLTISFSGRTVGNRPAAAIIENANDVTIAGCSGAAIITRTAKGAFSLIPIADAFEVKCDLRLSGSDRLAMHVLPSVLDVQAGVSDGELITGDEDAVGGRNFSLVRQVATTGERLAATATGRYRITLLPDATRFDYAIDVRNPNRSTSTLPLALQSAEHLQEIDSAAPYEIEGNRYVFTIPPGDSNIRMRGELRGSAFRAPVEASLQYFVLESHPLIRPAVQSAAKRVSIAETGITPQYRGALAFEASKQQIAWQTTRLEALRTISYASKVATHELFVPLQGPVLGESVFHIRNEGAAEVVLPREPEPTYASLQNEPVFMTKDRSGRLTVPLSAGEQSLLVQHRQGFSQSLGFGAGEIRLPQLEVATSQTHVTMRYPAEWIPLYERFATRSVLWTPDFGMIVLFGALAIWLERLLAWLRLPIARRLFYAAIGSLAATIVLTFLIITILVGTALTVAWLATLPIRQRVSAAFGVGLAAFFVFIVVGMSQVSLSKYEGSSEYGMESARTMTETAATDTAMTSTDTSAVGVADRPQTQAAYQGLPAKFDLPRGSRYSRFEQELLPVGRAQSVMVFAVSMAVVKWIGFILAIITLLMLARDWRSLTAAVRERLAARSISEDGIEPVTT
jgi:hypothetical protein